MVLKKTFITFKQHIRERKKTKITIRITVPINNSNESGINSLVLRIGEETKITRSSVNLAAGAVVIYLSLYVETMKQIPKMFIIQQLIKNYTRYTVSKS